MSRAAPLLRRLLTLAVIAAPHVVADANKSQLYAYPSPSQKPQAVYMPQGIQIPTAPYPRSYRHGRPARYPSRRAFAGPPPDAPINFRAIRYAGPLAPHQTFRPRHQFAPPMSPWYGLPVPTPMGPYSQRRPPRPLPAHPPPAQPRGPLAPLAELDPKEKSRDDDGLNKPVPWQPYDTWQGAQLRGHVVQPPSPDELGDLAPPYVRVKSSRAKDAPPEPDEVGYVDAEPEPEEEPEQEPRSGKDIVRPTKASTKRARVFLWRRPSTIRLPELVGDEHAIPLLEEPAPDVDAALTEEETARPRTGRRRPVERSRAAPHNYISNSLLL